MTDDLDESERMDALKKAAELELRWQDAHAQRRRAADLFQSSATPAPDETDD